MMLDGALLEASGTKACLRTTTTAAIDAAATQPDLTIIVVNYNTTHLLERMISSLAAAQGQLSIQLIAIDNASRDVSPTQLPLQYPDVEWIINRDNVGFGRANNQALSMIRGRYVLLLNTDAFVSSDTLAQTIAFMEASPQCGILGVKLVGEDGALQPSCRYFPTPWNQFVAATGLQRLFKGTRMVDDFSWDHMSVRECDWVPGCYYLMRREVLDQVGLFDPRYFLYFEEVDHCKAARSAGWSVMFFPFTTVVHIGGESAKSQAPITSAGRQISTLEIESRLLYFRKHFGLSGVLATLFLATVKLGLAAVKDMIKRSGWLRSTPEFVEVRALWKTLFATRFASAPTR